VILNNPRKDRFLETKKKYGKKLSAFFDRLPAVYKAFREKYQQRLLLFLFFIVLSFIFWFIRALNEVYQSDITYPIKYTKFPADKILTGELPNQLKLRVEASGMNILARKLHLNVKALKFNVESFSFQKSGNNSFYILTKQVREFIMEDMENIRILNISPDTLFFNFTSVETRKIEVRPSIKNRVNLFAKQYTLNGIISTSPDSIIATGPFTILDTLKFVNTEPVELTNLTDSVTKTYNLRKIDQLEFNKKKIKVMIPVDKFTETAVNSEIVLKNVPDTLELKTFPNNVRIKYRVTLTNYDKIRPEMLKPYVDYLDIDKTLSSKLQVWLTDTPDYIHGIKIIPGSVEYLIEK
jgi:hypothetical protein